MDRDEKDRDEKARQTLREARELSLEDLFDLDAPALRGVLGDVLDALEQLDLPREAAP